MKWNERGEFEYRGQLIKNSNLTDLVNDVLRKRKKASDPLGWETFAEVLQRSNVPQELIGNPTRWSYMREEKKSKTDNEDFHTPPLGETPKKWRGKKKLKKQQQQITWASM